MSNSSEELQRLRKIGGTETLAAEFAALLDTINKSPESIPISCQLLARAAQEIRANHLDFAHDFIGAAVESWLQERQGLEPLVGGEAVAGVEGPMPEEGCWDGIPLPELKGSRTWEDPKGEELIAGFTNLLATAGFVEEARKYLSGWNLYQEQFLQGDPETMKTKGEKDMLKAMVTRFKAEGNLNMARVTEQLLAESEEEVEEGDEEELDEGEGQEVKEDEVLKTPDPDDMEEPEDQPELDAGEPSEEEMKEKEEAKAAVKAGNLRKAKRHLKKAARLERTRVIAALIDKGDFALAAKGIAEAEGEDMPPPVDQDATDHDTHDDDVLPEEKNAGLGSDDEELVIEDEDAACGPEGCKGDDDECEEPNEHEVEMEESKGREEQEEGEDMNEETLAATIVTAACKSVKAKNMKKAKEAVADLASLEKAVVEGVRKAEEELKDQALASEGYEVWKKVRRAHLDAALVVAEGEGDEEGMEEAEKGIEALEDEEGEDEIEDTLDAGEDMEEGEEGAPEAPPVVAPEAPPAAPIVPVEPKPETPAPVAPEAPAPAPEGEEKVEEEEGEEDEEEDEKGEAEGMKYEVLQRLEDIKNARLDRSALAFTLWDDGTDPYWVIQAAGKPVGEVHLGDQDSPEDIREFFVNQERWPNVIAQTTEKVGLYEMMKGIKARFYANAVEASTFGKEMKAKVTKEMDTERKARLIALRNDLTDAVAVAAESLNKGLIPGKINALKRAFTDRLMALGIHNPALIVEDCFGEGFTPFMEQVVADANELLEMPKEAFAHTKKMITSATNMAQASVSNAYAQETLAQRLGRTSMPLATMPIEEEIKASSDREGKNELRKKLRLGSRF